MGFSVTLSRPDSNATMLQWSRSLEEVRSNKLEARYADEALTLKDLISETGRALKAGQDSASCGSSETIVGSVRLDDGELPQEANVRGNGESGASQEEAKCDGGQRPAAGKEALNNTLPDLVLTLTQDAVAGPRPLRVHESPSEAVSTDGESASTDETHLKGQAVKGEQEARTTGDESQAAQNTDLGPLDSVHRIYPFNWNTSDRDIRPTHNGLRTMRFGDFYSQADCEGRDIPLGSSSDAESPVYPAAQGSAECEARRDTE